MNMENKINRETVNLFSNKLAKLFNNFFPGIVVLELFFKRGYFSNQPVNVFDFILYLFWCGILSIPYNFIQPTRVATLIRTLINKIPKSNMTKEQINEENEFTYDAQEYVELGFVLLKILLTYLVYKLLLIFSVSPSLIGINPSVMLMCICIIITLILSYPVAVIYAYILERFFSKYLEEVK